MIDVGKPTAINTAQISGYAGQILRVNLTSSKITSVPLDNTFLRQYIGGAALGFKYLYDEVTPETGWSDPGNRLFIGSGPLGGTRVGGSGSITVVTKGALTQGITSTQANGFFGAYLKFSGFDSIILEGAAPEWAYIYIHDGTAELKNAGHLLGKDTYQVDQILKEELGKGRRDLSVLSIGPAGENLVRFACIFVDLGHIAAHNGVGAVMGSKKIKAIVVARGKNGVPLKDSRALSIVAGEILDRRRADKFAEMTANDGTLTGIVTGTRTGNIPVKNYTTGINTMAPEVLSTYTPQNIRSKFKAKPSPCWACFSKHCHMMQVPDGKYAGRAMEEPEYEGLAAFSTLVGVSDLTTSMVLANEVDRLGFDANEAGWVMSWLMECYEKRILTSKETNGLEMTWGNGEAIMEMLRMISRREGFGDILAEGVMRAAKKVGGMAPDLAIHTLKGNTPRGHDHRVMWLELFDTCVSNTGTLEAHLGAPLKMLGLNPMYDKFDPEAISTVNAKIKGAMIFEDSLVTCRFNTMTALDLLCRAVNAATGWNIDVDEAMTVGRRAVNLARSFNLRHGISAELDAPSMRYGSTPLDGVAAGKGIMPHWDKMLRNYYRLMGWSEKGWPLPDTLKALGLNDVIPQLWPTTNATP